MRRPWLLLVLTLALAAAEPDLLEPALQLRSRLDYGSEAVRRWRTLFLDEPRWTGRDIAFIGKDDNPHNRQLLVSRLLYAGPPWSARGAGQRSGLGVTWAERDREIKAGILRELRYQPDPSLLPVYLAFLATSSQPGLLSSAAVNARRLDADAVAAQLARLADPAHPEALPAAATPSVRMQALDLLLDPGPERAGLAERGLRHALLTARGEERLRALRRLRRDGRDSIHLEAATKQLMTEWRDGSLPGSEREALVQMLDCSATLDPADLLALLGAGSRDLAAPAAAALLRQRWRPTPVDLVALEHASTTCSDVVLRSLLQALILGMDATSGPWTRWAEHRAQLAAWRAARP